VFGQVYVMPENTVKINGPSQKNHLTPD